MKRIRFFNFSFLPLIFLLSFNSATIFAQEDFASLRKNINTRAKELNHDLNSSKDTLILKCKQKIHRLYTVGKTEGLDVKINAFSYKMPLRDLKKGKYLMVAQLRGKKIVFEVNVLQRQPHSLNYVNEVLASGLMNKDFVNDMVDINARIKAGIIIGKPYNLTDLSRKGMQSREDCRRLMAIERERLREAIKQKRLKTLAMR